MKKVYLSRLLKISALVVPLAVLFFLLQGHIYCFGDHNTERIENFYLEEKDSLDVVFMGASEVMAGYIPGYAYDLYGYTSYNYCMDSNTGALYKSQLKEILAHQDPQLIVVETYGFYGTLQRLQNEARFRIYSESIPMSANKIETIMDFEYEDKASCFFPFIKYHGDSQIAQWRYNNIVRGREFNRSASILKGVMTRNTIYGGPWDYTVVPKGSYVLEDYAKEYLLDFLSYCKEQNIENIVFVNFPRYAPEFENDDEVTKIMAFADNVRQIVGEYGYPYIDLQTQASQMGLDFNTDFYNSHHMNTYGAKKVTEYLGKVIMQDYRLVPMDQSPENEERWKLTAEYSNRYLQWADRCIQENEDIMHTRECHILAEINKHKP